MEKAEFEGALRDVVGAENVRAEEPLSAHTTFAIGGPAEWLVEPASAEEVRDVVALCREADAAWRVLGLGSNILAADAW